MTSQPSARPEVSRASNCFCFEKYNALLTHLILLRRLTGMDLAPPCIMKAAGLAVCRMQRAAYEDVLTM
jgi:hypothetical protein